MNLNWDMIGRKSKEGDDFPNKVTVHTSVQVPLFRELVEKNNNTTGLDIKIIERDVKESYGGGASDHMPFAEKNIGAIYMETGLHPDLHQPSDHVDLINFDDMEKIVKLGFLIVNEIANMDKRPVFDKSLNN